MKNIKPILQNDCKDCGVCCMQWLIIYYGGYVSLEKLREDTFTDLNGTTAFHIINAFKKWNFDSLGVWEHDIKNEELKLPLIAHLRLENGYEHFVVVKEVSKNAIYLMDPSIGYKKLSLEEFNKVFTGNIILAYPRNELIKMTSDMTIFKLFINILKKEKLLISKIVLVSLLWTIFTIISSYYLKIGSNILNEEREVLKYLILIFGIFTISKILCLFIREYYENHLSNLIDVYLYPNFLKHLFYLPLKNIKSRSTGEIITRIGELANIKSLFSEILVSGFLDSLMFIVSIVILYFMNIKLFMILLLFIIIYIIYGYVVSRIIYQKVLKNINYQTDFNSVLVEEISMLESIKNLNIIDKMLVKIEKVLAKYLYNNYQFNSFINSTNFGKDFILELCFFLINSYGFYCILNGSISIINLFTFNIILSYCIDPVKNIVSLLPKYNYIKATYSKIMEFINIEEEKINKDSTTLKGNITFKNVNYSYNNYNYILKNINFNIEEGMHVLLDGTSGSGKSTICNLIYKNLVPNEGNIYINNVNIKDIDINTIRNNILYISQDENLFTGTIKENIIINREVDNKYFEDICDICEIESIVNKKTMRYDSLIEPNSKNLSGGEKQRIILARGLLKNNNIIILDEALSEVDQKLESKIIKNIRKYFKDKTIIYISHKNQKNNFKNIYDIEAKNGIL